VVLGGLVPELLCSSSAFTHAGTTDVDVQVNLEIAARSVNAVRLEHALRNAEFEPDNERVWRWRADGTEAVAEIKFELLADLAGIRTSLDDLRDNFADPLAQGAQAYADSFHFDHPEQDHHALAVEAVAAVNDFHDAVTAEE
jgi:hypothetical protein